MHNLIYWFPPQLAFYFYFFSVYFCWFFTFFFFSLSAFVDFYDQITSFLPPQSLKAIFVGFFFFFSLICETRKRWVGIFLFFFFFSRLGLEFDLLGWTVSFKAPSRIILYGNNLKNLVAWLISRKSYLGFQIKICGQKNALF